jgi:hypothetical protein
MSIEANREIRRIAGAQRATFRRTKRHRSFQLVCLNLFRMDSSVERNLRITGERNSDRDGTPIMTSVWRSPRTADSLFEKMS